MISICRILILLPLTLTGCLISNKSQTKKDPSKALTVSGTYAGMLPCADCEGIDYRLTLTGASGFSSSLTYKGRSVEPVQESGSFGFDGNGNIVLDKKGDGMKYFRVVPDGLQMLDVNRRSITGPLADYYYLTLEKNKPGEPEGNVAMANIRNWEKGNDFYAQGNEPFWSLEMDFDKQFSVSTPEGRLITVPAVEGVKAQDADITRYRAVTAAGELIITLSGIPCEDNMSGEKYTHQVKIDFRKSTDLEYRTMKGCGRFTIPPRLNDIWILTNINGRSIKTEGLPKGAPTLEFNIRNGMVSGHGGCNGIGCEFSLMEPGKILFGNIISTMMACPNMESENALKQALSGRQVSYRFEDLKLILKGRNDEIFEFKKVD